MSDIRQEISEDYDYDADDALSAIFTQLDTDARQADNLGDEISQLLDSTVAIESFGMTSSTFAVMKLSGLLKGTSLDAIALETYGSTCPTADAAMESLLEKIKDKMTHWADRILNFMSDMSKKTLSMFSSMYDGLITKLKAADQSARSAGSAAVAHARAHPVATVLTAITAAAAIGGVIVFAASGMPLATAGEIAMRQFVSKLTAMMNGTKMVGKVVKATASAGGTRLLLTLEKAGNLAKGATAAAGGWTSSAFKVVGSKLTEMWAIVKRGVLAFAHKVISAVRSVNDLGGEAGNFAGAKVSDKTGSKLAGWATTQTVNKGYMTALWAVVGAGYKLIKAGVLKAFRMVKDVVYGPAPQAEPQAQTA